MPSGYKIVDGPGKWDLMLAFFDDEDVNPRRVTLKVRNRVGEIERVNIETVGIEKLVGAREAWSVTGSAVSLGVFSMQYSPRTRSGHITFALASALDPVCMNCGVTMAAAGSIYACPSCGSTNR